MRSSRECQLHCDKLMRRRETAAPGAIRDPGLDVNNPRPTNIDRGSSNGPGSGRGRPLAGNNNSSGCPRTGASPGCSQLRDDRPPPPWSAGQNKYDTDFPPLHKTDVGQTVREVLKALNIDKFDTRRITEPDNSYW